MATFVIVHGAWGGAWSWNKYIVPMLREAGQTVFAVTLTGLGERSHLSTPEVSLDTHIQDVVNVLFYEDLNDVILVGHSYGGNVITGAADRIPERIQQLVYLDAATPAPTASPVDATRSRSKPGARATAGRSRRAMRRQISEPRSRSGRVPAAARCRSRR